MLAAGAVVCGIVSETVVGARVVSSVLVTGTRTVIGAIDCLSDSSERINVVYTTLAIKLATIEIPSRIMIPLGVKPPPIPFALSKKDFKKSNIMGV